MNDTRVLMMCLAAIATASGRLLPALRLATLPLGLMLMVCSLPALAQGAVPAAPTGLTAVPKDAAVLLYWGNPSDNTITSYSVRSATSTTELAAGTWQAASGSATSTFTHRVSGLANGTRYYFDIRATNANGDSQPSNTATIQLPASPSATVSIPDSNLRAALVAATRRQTITQLNMAELTGTRQLIDKSIVDVTGLEHAINVTHLDLYGNSIVDVTPLASLTSLTTLTLDRNSIANVAPLASLTSLTTLRLRDNLISNATPLASLTALTTLDLSLNSISNVTPLASLTALTTLQLFSNSIVNVTPLASLTSLETLDLGRNSIVNAAPLASLTSLRAFSLRHNSIVDVTPLASLTSLSTLYLHGNSIVERHAARQPYLSDRAQAGRQLDRERHAARQPHLSGKALSGQQLDRGRNAARQPLQSGNARSGRQLDRGRDAAHPLSTVWKRLIWAATRSRTFSRSTTSPFWTTLKLGDNSIADATPLARLVYLETLDLVGNPIRSASNVPLASFGSLTNLLLSGRWISDAVLASLVTTSPSLEVLTLKEGSISDLTPLASLADVSELNLSDNSISDIEPLLGIFARGPSIDLRGNELSATSVDTHIPTLRRLYSPVRLLFDAPSEPPVQPPNRAPEAVSSVSDVQLVVGERLVIDVAGYFGDPDFDALTYSVVAGTPAVATAGLVWQGVVYVEAVAEGWSSVVVTARDPAGLSASVGFRVVVGNPVSFARATGGLGAFASAPEGGVASLTVSFANVRAADTTFRYALGVDADPITADADAEDHGDAGGTVTIPVGATSTVITIPIRDDTDIEPAREVFTVTLEAPEGIVVGGAGVATVHIEEGVCDRSVAVRVALAGSDCTAPTPAQLAAVSQLVLQGRGISSLREDDLAGLSALRSLYLDGNALETLPAGLFSATPTLHELILSGNALEALPAAVSSAPSLRRLRLRGNRLAELEGNALASLTELRHLDLSDNALEELPDGLFAGLGSLQSVYLHENPGAPFALRVAFERTDAAPWSPGPATVRLALPTGAPFEVESELSAMGGTLRDADGMPAASARVPAGATSSMALMADAVVDGDAVRLATTVPAVPTMACDGLPCWQGLELAAGEPLVLFSRPPTARFLHRHRSLFGHAMRLPLNTLAVAGDAGDLRWTVVSSDEAVATAYIDGDELVVEPVDYFVEGEVRIEAVATDALGQSVSVPFDVYVEFYWPVRPGGWRGAVQAAQ